MVARTGEPSPQQSAPSNEDDAPYFGSEMFDPHKQGGLRRLVVSVARLADIQGRIWLTEFKLTALRLTLYTALFGAAALFGILGIIFLFIGCFHVLTDLLHLPTVYAYLLFGGVQIALALLIALIANKKLTKKTAPQRTKPEAHS